MRIIISIADELLFPVSAMALALAIVGITLIIITLSKKAKSTE